VEKTSRGRGGTIYWCREGVFLLKPYIATEKRSEILCEILSDWEKQGFLTDVFVRNKEGKIIVMDGYQNVFVLRKWFDGRECDVMQEEEVLRGVKKLVELQKFVASYSLPEDAIFVEPKTSLEQLKKHSRELKYVYNYVGNKKHKTEFEEKFRSIFPDCYKDAEKAIGILKDVNVEECRYQICHKDYTHHNLLITGDEMLVVNFDNMLLDCRVSDFVQLLRKVMEKHDWDEALGKKMVCTYIEEGELSKGEQLDLYARMLYPVRFWKIVNHYSNMRKTMVNLRDKEKLDKFLLQEERRQQFLVFLHSLIV